MQIKILESQNSLYGFNRKLDVVLLHAPWCWAGHCTPEQAAYSWLDGWRNLEKIHQNDLVSAIGVSNVNEDELNEVLDIANVRVSVVQNWMDPFHQDKAVREICKSRNIVYMAYSTLGSQWIYIREVGRNPVPTDPTLQAIARKHDTSVTRVVLSWALQEGVVIIPKSTQSEHIYKNARILTDDPVVLDLSDMMQIRALDE